MVISKIVTDRRGGNAPRERAIVAEFGHARGDTGAPGGGFPDVTSCNPAVGLTSTALPSRPQGRAAQPDLPPTTDPNSTQRLSRQRRRAARCERGFTPPTSTVT
ncbi:hypothetical protein GCM10009559_63510 [Pseudonocardia zijingensis]|uniref:Uncharacterized protein n=1 Tax=Pseudonocardia zijingensis TaxID=153376 RepID=A0ABP3YMN2_9PSEU